MKVSLNRLLFFLFLYYLQCNGDDVENRRELRGAVDKNIDLNLIKTHLPLKDGDNVFFWRLQKVGSSTMLSILMSYAYRYNFLPRRKGSNNSQCRRIGQCALDNAEQHGLLKNETNKLKKFVEARTPGSTKTLSPITQNIKNTEALTLGIPFKISLSHELCNLEEKHVRNNIACSFTNPEWPREFKQGSPVKEIFMVRDPVSRAISVYYFWGELFKLAKVNKDQQDSEIREHTDRSRDSTRSESARSDSTRSEPARSSVQSDSARSGEVSPNSQTHVISTKRGGRVTSEDETDDGRQRKSKSGGSSVSKSSSGDVVISVKGKLAETPHNINTRGGAAAAALRKKDIRQFGRLLGEEDPEVLEEAERLLVEDEYFSDYYHSQEYLDQMVVEQPLIKSPFKRSRRQLSSAEVDKPKAKLGTATNYNKTVDGKMFMYHGDESTVPPMELAMGYASNLPFTAGMPGPSLSYSAFADKLSDALDIVKSDRMMTVVVERLDESLVVLSHYLGWSLADMVVTKHRKALSTHPKASEWPKASIDAIRRKMNVNGEYTMYNASKAKLDQRIAVLNKQGVDVAAEVSLLQALQKRVTSICLDDTYLLNYREEIKSRGYPAHPSENKLRDVEEKYLENGHIFSFNREIMCSFDLCGSCEAHALLYNRAKGGMSEGKNIEQTATLSSIPVESIKDNVNFKKCPKTFTYPLPSSTTA